MKIAIVDSNYNDDKFHGLAHSWLLWELKKAGISIVEKQNAEYLLCTVSSQQGVKDLKRELKKAKNETAKIILGGGGCWAPGVFENIADVICVGEGQRFIRHFLKNGYDSIKQIPETWIKNECKQVVPFENGFPWDCPPLNHPDGTVRVFSSRGCKKKCLFCQTGWEQSYKINPDIIKVQRQVDSLIFAGKKVCAITNDGSEESIRLKGQQEFMSASYQFLKKNNITKNETKSIRIGVEGVSERIRIAIKKPIDSDGLCKISFDALSKGIGVRWFFIAGLPCENSDDWQELRYLIKQIKNIPKGVIMMNFHAYIPQPATPLCVLPIVDEYWEPFEDFRKWFFDGLGFTRRVQIIAPAQYKGRMDRACESMAATEEQIRKGWFNDDNINWRVKYLLSPKKMRDIANKYLLRMTKTYLTK